MDIERTLGMLNEIFSVATNEITQARIGDTGTKINAIVTRLDAITADFETMRKSEEFADCPANAADALESFASVSRELEASLPGQPVRVAAVLTGLRDPAGPWGPGRAADAYDACEAARTIGAAAGVEIDLVADQHLPWHPGRCARLEVDGQLVGHAGELHPAVEPGRLAVHQVVPGGGEGLGPGEPEGVEPRIAPHRTQTVAARGGGGHGAQGLSLIHI